MSEILVNTIKKADGTGSITVPAETGTVVTTAAGSVEGAMTTQIGGRRNLIINGAQIISQRQTSKTNFSNGDFVTDRWQHFTNGFGSSGTVVDGEQVPDAPDGFKKSMKITVTTAGGLDSADNYGALGQKFEHQNISQFLDSDSVTVSFYVKSSLATTYAVILERRNVNTGTTGDVYVANYTINSANTWERKTITIPTNSTQASGDDNAYGATLIFVQDLKSGGSRDDASLGWNNSTTTIQINSAATDNGFFDSANTWQITGVQLEVGSVATPFEHRSYGEELNLCRRYLIQTEHYGSSTTARLYTSSTGSVTSTNSWVLLNIQLPNEMRATPSIKYSDVAGNIDKLSLWTSTGGGMSDNVAPHTDYADKNSFTISEYYSAKMGVIIGGYKAEAEL